ncbi:MAG: hypothetical protein JO345_19380 [Streptosporangiaceae bacterium]|nr:hypothetical protein [Streptosporangiaceae bacterium]
MDAELAALASTAATTIVTLLTTDAWDQVKQKVTMLWHRFMPDQADALETGLARDRLEIQAADATMARAITLDWESRLLRLLSADATAADALRHIVAELSQLPGVQQVHGAISQHAEANHNSTVIQVAGDWQQR